MRAKKEMPKTLRRSPEKAQRTYLARAIAKKQK